MSAERAKAEGKTVLGRITGYATAARKPVEFTIAPADAIRKLFERTKTTAGDVDLWEINEAFAVVAIANNQLLEAGPVQGERPRRRDRRSATPSAPRAPGC